MVSVVCDSGHASLHHLLVISTSTATLVRSELSKHSLLSIHTLRSSLYSTPGISHLQSPSEEIAERPFKRENNKKKFQFEVFVATRLVAKKSER